MQQVWDRIHSIALIVSFSVLIIVSLLFWFKNNPPRIAGLFTEHKPGALLVDIEKPINVNSPFKVQIKIDSQNQAVNAVGLYLRFDPSYLTVIDFDTTQSFCQFYPEKKFNNDIGTISLACGAPHPGVSDINTLVNVTFLPLKVGKMNLYVDPQSQILLSNGKGTNILDDHPVFDLTINNQL